MPCKLNDLLTSGLCLLPAPYNNGVYTPWPCVCACVCALQLAWHPCQLEPLVRSALPFVLETAWQPIGDKEMLLLQVIDVERTEPRLQAA